VKAISIRQAGAWLIVTGHRDIENRDWPTDFRGRVYVHADLEQDYDVCHGYPAHISDWREVQIRSDLGAIVGEVDIIDCVTESYNPSFVGPYGFVLANPVAYDAPIPCKKGSLGFFEPKLSAKPSSAPPSRQRRPGPRSGV